MDAFQEQVAGFLAQLFAVGIIVGGALFYLRRFFGRHGGLSERDRKAIDQLSAALLDATLQLRDELEETRKEVGAERAERAAQRDRLNHLEGRLNEIGSSRRGP